ncbi:UMP kinase [Candidatus Kaiserbacteria bacterium]|nr:UMP kinase [Candidatus Kaiserbacteria bacterium]MCB9811671.1 UMP kinase [Candidatus Nomurabacteria bacterium]
MQETIVMSVGGSLIAPDQIDTSFLTGLKQLIESEIQEHGRRFVIIAGGGKTARRYQDAAYTVAGLDDEDLDWIGIHATRLNGHLLRTIFKDTAHRVMVTNPDDVLDAPAEANLIVAAGYRPGGSTDLRAIQIAEKVGAKKVINLSNIDYVYTADPRRDETAEKIEDITWTDFRKLIPEDWDPGLSTPFDPVAAREAEAHDIEVAAINGAHLEELQKYLRGENFIGTRIHN